MTADGLVEALMGCAGRATLPFREMEEPRRYGTAFWYNHLIEDTAEREVFIQYLITAEALTTGEVAAFAVRSELGDPAPSAANLLMMDFRDCWTSLPGLGVAVMPAATLHAYAEGKGWRWNTDEITDGVAAVEGDIATIGRRPVDAYLLGHDVGEGEVRDQSLFVGSAAMDGRGRLRWTSRAPAGCVGAPVFVSIPVGDERLHRLVCLGVVLPGEGGNEIAPFDRIRKGIAALNGQPSRRWWKKRRN